MATLESIQKFLGQQPFAVAGVSRKDQKFGSVIYKELVKKNIKVYPVNPAMDTYKGVPCYPTVQSLPADTGGLVIVTHPSQTLGLIRDGESRGIHDFWVQQGAESEEAMAYARQSSSNIVFKECLFMHVRPVGGVHGVHRFFRKMFGSFPK